MKSLLLSAGLALVASTSTSFAAGDAATAMEIAQAHEACGENGTIISARFLDDGRVGVRCARGAGVFGAGGGAGGAVATNFAPIAGGLFAIALGAAAIGGSSSSSDTQ